MDNFCIADAELLKFCRFYMRTKSDLPIRPSEMGVLNIICATPGPHTPVGLAGRLCVSKPMIAVHLSVLLNGGYITRVPSPEDGRSFYILPTKKARNLIAQVRLHTDKKLGNLLTILGQKKFDELIKIIIKANKALDEINTGH